MKTITCVVVPVGQEPYAKEICNDNSTIQELVGGYFELVRLSNRLLLLCDEEAKLKGCEGNRRIGSEIIAGQFIIVGDSGEDFNSLDKYEVAAMIGRFRTPEHITPAEVEDSCKITFGEW
jgi:hypothetical protein